MKSKGVISLYKKCHAMIYGLWDDNGPFERAGFLPKEKRYFSESGSKSIAVGMENCEWVFVIYLMFLDSNTHAPVPSCAVFKKREYLCYAHCERATLRAIVLAFSVILSVSPGANNFWLFWTFEIYVPISHFYTILWISVKNVTKVK